MDKHKLLVNNQFGFIDEDTSTSSAILELIDKITEAMNNKECDVTVFIDLTKAFDVIAHSSLLRKLSHYGIRGTACFKTHI